MSLPPEIIVEHCQRWNDKHTLILRGNRYLPLNHPNFREEMETLEVFEDADVCLCAAIAYAAPRFLLGYEGLSDVLGFAVGSLDYTAYFLGTPGRMRITFHNMRNLVRNLDGQYRRTNVIEASNLPGGSQEGWHLLTHQELISKLDDYYNKKIHNLIP